MSTVAEQRRITRIALASVEGTEFALAGSGAVREHGLLSRETKDVDLFTSRFDARAFDDAVGSVTDALREHGYGVEEVRRAEMFATLRVGAPGGAHVDVDLGVDWRARDAVRSDVGPVLSLEDAVGGKISALYTRAGPQDFVDVDAIRRTGRMDDAAMLRDARERDPGFDVPMFAQQLETVRRLRPESVERYGLDAAGLFRLQERFTAWAGDLREDPEGTGTVCAAARERLRASYPLGPAVAQPPSSADERRSTTLRSRAPHREAYGAEP